QYLAAVGQGDELIVTDRGRAVAKITPIGATRTIDQLIAEGIVTPAGAAKRPARRRRIKAEGPVASLVTAQRR
ncbi:MAG TPA: prevent-host-death protein, partial [Acidimicrobiales bacterium]